MNEYILREYSQAMEVDVYNEIRGISSDWVCLYKYHTHKLSFNAYDI